MQVTIVLARSLLLEFNKMSWTISSVHMWSRFVVLSLSSFLCLGLVLLFSTPTFAGIFADGTRVVFKDGYSQQSLRLSNQNVYPILVQAWVDDGEKDRTPEQADSPIFTMPPIFKMAPQEQFSLRLVYSGEPLPQDRESIFWLNLYEIPPKPDAYDLSTSLVLAMRTQIKVFYRPQKLSMSVDKLIKNLQFSIQKINDRSQLIIQNATPFFATINALQVTQGEWIEEGAVDMIAPFESVKMNLTKVFSTENGDVKIDVAILNDAGNVVIDSQVISIIE